MGGSKWLKAKMALGLRLNSCLYVPRTVEDSPPPAAAAAASLSPTPPRDSDRRVKMPTTPTPSSSGLLPPKHSFKSSKKICAICLETMKPGQGHAIFTAECSHSFHFHCIASNVEHGKQTCPVCRANWKEIPVQNPVANKSYTRPLPQNDIMRRIPSPQIHVNRQVAPLFHSPQEPILFNDDDEVVNNQSTTAPNSNKIHDDHFTGAVKVQTFPEVSAVPKSEPHNNFSILVHLKAPTTTALQQHSPQTSRAPVDLVTVLDVSGSMAGTKLALLKRAMGFVIQNLGPSDRLSVIAFSSTARRLFPLRKMTDSGRNEAIQAVNSLSSNGGTNIAEGLKKGAKVLIECKWKNPIRSIILLSDGQDTYANRSSSDHQSLLPESVSGLHIPVHAFGFGVDHDAVLMHSISENSGGTFSFIEAENVIQDAFAQCIGGILSVVVQELKVEIECIDSLLKLVSVKSGSYKTVVESDKRKGSIEVGDLYAEEERDFLVTTDIPICEFTEEMLLLKVRCVYKHPMNSATNNCESVVGIQRPLVTGPVVVSMEVDRQRNRLRSAEAMEQAKTAAERGDLTFAVSVLENCRRNLSETVSARAGDRLCAALDAELREMQERMASRQVYETSGRAYVLSGLSSHCWQRATARGDSTDSTSLVHAYQTQSMVDMVHLSQTMPLGIPPSASGPAVRPVRARSFNARPQPR
ncbi:hypothetical protein ABFS82_04G196200 [Erythranthe guttata]|uniref:uncharacterized protein LOC105949135 n=1 Tax=Erythranthe guttata TaxID=4155 RepID=UPI00064DEA9C|nr:PREDICTED: uncharacterized protein LOC105949135 [Erythranthe guttata]|eukprot:XP_012827865.1 PREDICTED: uncharacterized protein LOC105949135 [Erythranthe guttata]